jgi:hypothetical protein
VKVKGNLFIAIKRGIYCHSSGEHKITSENQVAMDKNCTCDFKKEILCFYSLTLFYDTSLGTYQQKEV